MIKSLELHFDEIDAIIAEQRFHELLKGEAELVSADEV